MLVGLFWLVLTLVGDFAEVILIDQFLICFFWTW